MSISIGHQDVFVGYSQYNEDNVLNKYRLTNHAIDIKSKLISKVSDEKQSDMREKLDDVATRIQRRLNDANLNDSAIHKYRKELLIIGGDESLKDIIEYVKCCTLLAKHSTSFNTKTNWFYVFVNETESITRLRESSEYSIKEKYCDANWSHKDFISKTIDTNIKCHKLFDPKKSYPNSNLVRVEDVENNQYKYYSEVPDLSQTVEIDSRPITTSKETLGNGGYGIVYAKGDNIAGKIDTGSSTKLSSKDFKFSCDYFANCFRKMHELFPKYKELIGIPFQKNPKKSILKRFHPIAWDKPNESSFSSAEFKSALSVMIHGQACGLHFVDNKRDNWLRLPNDPSGSVRLARIDLDFDSSCEIKKTYPVAGNLFEVFGGFFFSQIHGKKKHSISPREHITLCEDWEKQFRALSDKMLRNRVPNYNPLNNLQGLAGLVCTLVGHSNLAIVRKSIEISLDEKITIITQLLQGYIPEDVSPLNKDELINFFINWFFMKNIDDIVAFSVKHEQLLAKIAKPVVPVEV